MVNCDTSVISGASTGARITSIFTSHRAVARPWRHWGIGWKPISARLPNCASFLRLIGRHGQKAVSEAFRAGLGYRTVDETQNDLSSLASDYPDLAQWQVDRRNLAQGQWDTVEADDLHVLVVGQSETALIPGHHWSSWPLSMRAKLVTAESATRFAEWLVLNYAFRCDGPVAA